MASCVSGSPRCRCGDGRSQEAKNENGTTEKCVPKADKNHKDLYSIHASLSTSRAVLWTTECWQRTRYHVHNYWQPRLVIAMVRLSGVHVWRIPYMTVSALPCLNQGILLSQDLHCCPPRPCHPDLSPPLPSRTLPAAPFALQAPNTLACGHPLNRTLIFTQTKTSRFFDSLSPSSASRATTLK